MSNYKDTLNILKTDFEMRANLNVKEPKIEQKWLDDGIYQKLLQQNRDNKQWILHDGPPYANGNIHVGHALNKIIKDIIVRYRLMRGFCSPYIPGWDTHGLPIEHALQKNNKDYNKLSIVDKRNACEQFAEKFIKLQTEQFKRLGLITDFLDIYKTYTKDYENRQLEVLLQAINEGLIYQDLKPIYWSWSSQSALADAEIEYANEKSPSIYVTFNVVGGKEILNKNDKLVIWTTTPWTIPSNLAIAVNPKFTYVRIQCDNDFYILAKECLEKISKVLKWENYSIVNEINGKDLEDIQYQHPLYERISPIILADYVTIIDGTGLVHNAPGFGSEDYLACKKYNIKPFCPIDKYGKFTKEVDDEKLFGLFYDDSNKLITERLFDNKSLLKLDFIIHSVAHDWRTKKPVIYRAAKQWFIDIKKIQPQILKTLDQVNFKNKQNKNHIVEMIKNRYEWCISRQRVWGVPIPIIYDENNQPIFNFELLNNIISLIGKHGSNIWWEKPVEFFLTKELKNIPNVNKYRKETDIMDVWFDSGTSFTLLKDKSLNCPADLYFEGNDQYRGWFNSSLINGVILQNQAPYKYLLSHGMVLDEQGRKMSKSIGNVIDPLQVCNSLGADILRIWVANSNYQEDIRISKNILDQNAEIYRRLRNTLFKFCLANISDFDFKKQNSVKFNEVDQYILYQLINNIDTINNAYKNYDFDLIIKIINNHVIELSSWYFDLIKDTLYCESKNDINRKTIQTVLFYILKSYLIVLTPIIPHTCEEVYSFLKMDDKKESVMLEKWIDQIKLSINNVDINKWEYFKNVKNVVYSQLENLRIKKQINKNNQALVELSFNNSYAFKEEQLAKYLNVAKVTFIKTDVKDISCEVSDAHLIRCERCWNYYDKSQMADEHICKRCHKIISNS